MAFKVVDVLRANMVFRGIRFLPVDSDFDAFREAMGTEVVRRTEIADEKRLDMVLMSRERTALLLGKDGSQIERQHLERSDLPEFADTISACVTNSTLGEDDEPEAYGCNMEFVFEQDSGLPAGKYLASQMLGEAIVADEVPWEFEAAGFELRLDEEGERTWSFEIQPRFWEKDTKRVFVKVNHHRDRQSLPDRREILEDLSLTWDRSQMLLDSIAQGGR